MSKSSSQSWYLYLLYVFVSFSFSGRGKRVYLADDYTHTCDGLGRQLLEHVHVPGGLIDDASGHKHGLNYPKPILRCKGPESREMQRFNGIYALVAAVLVAAACAVRC